MIHSNCEVNKLLAKIYALQKCQIIKTMMLYIAVFRFLLKYLYLYDYLSYISILVKISQLLVQIRVVAHVVP